MQRRWGGWAVPNPTVAILGMQVIAFIFYQMEPEFIERLVLVGQKVYAGEVWRLLTFMAVPPTTNLIFAFFAWYLFFLMGTALEQTWGNFRYNLYLLVGILSTIGVALVLPTMPVTNAFVLGSVFLAFAYLFPDFVLSLFFILPVKIKWLALLTWVGYAFTAVVGSWTERLLVAASVGNFLLFFGPSLLRQGRASQRRMVQQAGRAVHKDKPFHRCEVCGITDKSNPEMDFRYCSKCSGQHGYCTQHIFNHEHVTGTTVGSPQSPEAARGGE
jgi:hypothetical protein